MPITAEKAPKYAAALYQAADAHAEFSRLNAIAANQVGAEVEADIARDLQNAANGIARRFGKKNPGVPSFSYGPNCCPLC